MNQPKAEQSILHHAVKENTTCLKQFGIDIMHTFLTQHYDISYKEKVQIVKNHLGQKGMQLIQTLTWAEQEGEMNITAQTQ